MVFHMPEMQTRVTSNAHHVAVMSTLFIGVVIMTNVTETKVGNYFDEYFTVCVSQMCHGCVTLARISST